MAAAALDALPDEGINLTRLACRSSVERGTDDRHVPSSGHAGMGWVIAAALESVFARRQVAPFVAATNGESLRALDGLIEAGKVRPVIDRTFPLGETAKAFAYLDAGHARDLARR